MELQFHPGHATRKDAIFDLFNATFSASEGQVEGKVIGDSVRDLMSSTPSDDLQVWSAYEGDAFLGCIFLSRLIFAQDDRTVFILSPVAVKTDQQKRGIGQKLIAHGLTDLRQRGVDYVVTYGDPNYYARVGFGQITEEFAQAPLKLSFPEGWLGQALSPDGETPFIGQCRCVPALNKAELW